MIRADRRHFLRWATAGTAAVAGAGAVSSDTLARGTRRASGPSRSVDLVGVSSDDGSVVVAQHAIDHRTLDITVDSAALGQTASARVLLPLDFAAQPSTSWPVLYLLHGGLASYVSWTASSNVARLSKRANAIVVMPDGGRLGFYSDWWNRGNGTKPGWETFHLTELRQILERGLRAGDRRAIAGLSMGGFGAMSYAGRRPDLFRAAASFSGVLDPLHPTVAPITSSPYPDWLMQTFMAPLGYDPLGLWGHPVEQASIWRAHNPVDLVANMRGLKLFVSCGNGQLGPLDPPGSSPTALLALLEAALLSQSQKFVERARALGLDLTVDFYGPGTHTFPYWERELQRAFPLLTSAIGA
jgi:S-formylglutathione hydrolase FrmB